MHVLPRFVLLLFASVVSTIAVPVSQIDQTRRGFDQRHLEKRRGKCANGLREAIAYDDDGTRMVCIDDSKSRTDWSGQIAPIITASAAAIAVIGDRIVAVIKARRQTASANSSPVRRLARRGEEDRIFGNVTIGGVEVEVPFVHDGEGKSTMNLLDFYSQVSPSLETRSLADTDAWPTGGTVTFNADGTLDTFTVDFAVAHFSAATNATSSPLGKRDSHSLHTTYWAGPGHEQTSLSDYKLKGVVEASYTHQNAGVWESCGYMANSGTWHGAFRHWTGDRGYTNGECETARKY